MGLDMYAYSRADRPNKNVDFQQIETDEQFHYWRKHPNLHGWMEQLYREKGGEKEEFNCVSVMLTTDDLDKLEREIKGALVPNTSGFFFGSSDGSEWQDDLEFIASARKRIADGLTVFYSSWW